MTIAPTMPAGSYTLAPASCSGATLSGSNAPDYGVVYTSAAGRLHGDAGADRRGVSGARPTADRRPSSAPTPHPPDDARSTRAGCVADRSTPSTVDQRQPALWQPYTLGRGILLPGSTAADPTTTNYSPTYTSDLERLHGDGDPAPPPPRRPPRRRRRTAIGWSAPTAASSPSAPPSSTGRPGASGCSDLSSASARPRTRPGTGWWRPTAASSPSAMPATTGRYRGSGSRPPGPACRTASMRP